MIVVSTSGGIPEHELRPLVYRDHARTGCHVDGPGGEDMLVDHVTDFDWKREESATTWHHGKNGTDNVQNNCILPGGRVAGEVTLMLDRKAWAASLLMSGLSFALST